MSQSKTFPKNVARLRIPVVIVAVFLAGWYFGLPQQKDDAGAESAGLWTCSMHPQIRQPDPGLCPICSMDLIPLQDGGEQGGLRALSVSAEASALMDLRVSPIVREPASVHVDLFGKIAYDERNVNTTTARIGGRIDRFYIDYTGTGVSKGDHMAEIYSPDLFVAQKDLIQATSGVERARASGTAAAIQTQQRILDSARERLRLLQLTEMQIDAISRKASPDDHVTLFAPNDGIVTQRFVTEGTYIKTGDPLFSVAALDTVWLNLEAYESDLPWLHFAQDVAFTVDALPGKSFRGRIAYIDQEIDPMRRVVRVRVNVKNDDRLLKPGMFARAKVDAKADADGRVIDPGLAGKWISPMHPEVISDSPGQCTICGMDLVPAEQLGYAAGSAEDSKNNPLLVPASSVLKTGQRSLVYVRTGASPDPEFEGREIVIGPRVGDRYIVRSGLSEGEMVVTRGAFKLDSELQIRARPSMMNANAGMVEIPAAEADKGLLGQWSPVLRSLGRLQQAVESGNTGVIPDTLASLSATISAIQSEMLPPDTLTQWKEFAPRLQNALVLAQEESKHHPGIMFSKLTRAIEEAARFLGLPSQPEAMSESADPAKLATLRSALTAYHALAAALAADSLTDAEEHRDALVSILKDVEGAEPSVIEALDQATDIKALRLAFSPGTTLLSDQIKAYGKDQVGNVYVAHCPMAFDHTGADWLTPKPEILNPYFGAEMLNCGAISENLSIAPAAAPMNSDHHH
ncbi:MAG: efflux RND transporter periplasmic adaptor subunit [Verrucomicrobiales bacterium]